MPHRLLARLIAFLRRDRVERDLARQIEAHLGLLEEEYQRRGMTEAEARRQARIALGGVEQAKERHRDERSFPWLEDLRRDVPYAVRGLRRTPGFTVAAILTLALGIGATTAIFTVVNAVVLRPLPYPESHRLVRVAETVTTPGPSWTPASTSRRLGMTQDEFVQWRARTKTLDAMATVVGRQALVLSTEEGPVRLAGAGVSPAVFEMLGAEALLGRLFEADDERPDLDIVILAEQVWRRYFAADPAVIGRVVVLNGRSFTVVGVLPDRFRFLPAPDAVLWTPVAPRPGQGTSQFGLVLARLAPGVSVAAATAEANVIGPELRKAGPSYNYGTGPPAPSSGTAGIGAPLRPDGGQLERFQVLTLQSLTAEPVRVALVVLSCAAAIVLLVVCANVATLLLARGTARQHEIGVRMAIGAGRGRLVRQLLTEAGVLAVVGTTAGLVLATAGLRLIAALSSVSMPFFYQLSLNLSNGSILPRLGEIAIDRDVFTAGVSSVAVVLIGLLPAVHLTRRHGASLVVANTSRGGETPGRSFFRRALVVTQLVMATSLLVGAGLLVHSFARLANVETGYDAENALTFQPVLPQGSNPMRRWVIIEELIDRLQAVSGVECAGFSNVTPFLAITEYGGGLLVPPDKSPEEMLADPLRPQTRAVSESFLQTLGARLIAGRWLGPQDGAGQPLAMIVNRSLAERYFPARNAVGTLVRLQRTPERSETWQIVGVVDDLRQARLDEETFPVMYLDVRQMLARDGFAPTTGYLFAFPTVAVRVTGGAAVGVVASARAIVRELDPAASIDSVAMLEDVKAGSLVRPRFYSTVLGALAGLSGLLAIIGVYGLLAYIVAQRTREIGIRMALGAERASVLSLFFAQGLRLAVAGVLPGLLIAAAAARYLESLLYELTPIDPPTYATVAVLLLSVTALAAYVPARRATRVDPMTALRVE